METLPEDKAQKARESLEKTLGNLGPWLPPRKGPVKLPCGKYEIRRPSVSRSDTAAKRK